MNHEDSGAFYSAGVALLACSALIGLWLRSRAAAALTALIAGACTASAVAAWLALGREVSDSFVLALMVVALTQSMLLMERFGRRGRASQYPRRHPLRMLSDVAYQKPEVALICSVVAIALSLPGLSVAGAGRLAILLIPCFFGALVLFSSVSLAAWIVAPTAIALFCIQGTLSLWGSTREV